MSSDHLDSVGVDHALGHVLGVVTVLDVTVLLVVDILLVRQASGETRLCLYFGMSSAMAVHCPGRCHAAHGGHDCEVACRLFGHIHERNACVILELYHVELADHGQNCNLGSHPYRTEAGHGNRNRRAALGGHEHAGQAGRRLYLPGVLGAL